ncbi:putative RNA-binding protein with ribosomal protein S1 domain [Thermanaerovibrio velox DSM 12556]|jgi:S1 RNA binding domain protein|uniref:Putative RNA-binding protein with ribosomal protein S1 domain n=1 Tax=Thermanaerovibrio velox DSM 12556 TaxID=926567 RepID=H0UPZ6_9BACT|nr:S1 RNA-binding domain-containing protein [Thermanaerovibrio velox]EHM09625.1 putative RNA-binding protein with ribosomal protein S1 domain [Thermanaerovibrio velox DSM 12556]
MVEDKTVMAAAGVNVGDVVTGTVEHIAPYGAFVRLENGQKAMVHISELSHGYVKKVEDVLELQQKVTAKVIKIDERGRIDLSIKALKPREPKPQQRSAGGQEMDFEKKLSMFLKASDEKIADLNSKMKDSRGGKRKTGKR